jgi:glycolate oxidase FAD binding subunit
MLETNTILEELTAIVGPANLRAAAREDAVCGVAPQFIVEPQTEQHLAAVLSRVSAAGIAAIPRGGGTKLDWGNPPKRAGIILSTARLNHIVEHAWADLTVTVEAGCTLHSLQSTLAKRGQRLAFDGLWPERATIGGALSTNDSGSLRLRFGALRDLIIGVTLALPDGTLASSGGKVVKNVAGYDLPKLAAGAFGTLGVITRAVFRLHPLCRTTRTVTFTSASWGDMQQKLHAIQDSKLAHSGFQIRGHSGGPPHADLLFEATESGLAAQTELLQKLLLSESRGSSIPPSIFVDSSPQIWQARQNLFSTRQKESVIARFSVLPSDLAKAMRWLDPFHSSSHANWQAVVQATGIGFLRLDADPSELPAQIFALREQFERAAGSLVLLRRPESLGSLDAWGNPGDALPLMRAVKLRLDPQSTLNPGRFVGGI